MKGTLSLARLVRHSSHSLRHLSETAVPTSPCAGGLAASHQMNELLASLPSHQLLPGDGDTPDDTYHFEVRGSIPKCVSPDQAEVSIY